MRLIVFAVVEWARDQASLRELDFLVANYTLKLPHSYVNGFAENSDAGICDGKEAARPY